MDYGYAICKIDEGIFKKDRKYPIIALKDNRMELDFKGAIVSVEKGDPDFEFHIKEFKNPEKPFLLVYKNISDYHIFQTDDEEKFKKALDLAILNNHQIITAIQIATCADFLKF